MVLLFPWESLRVALQDGAACCEGVSICFITGFQFPPRAANFDLIVLEFPSASWGSCVFHLFRVGNQSTLPVVYSPVAVLNMGEH